MARIKKDKSSYNAGGVLHRDNRHDKSFDGPTGQSKKKNTKKWCKGKVGRARILEWKESKWSVSFRSRHPNSGARMAIVCTWCEKILEYDWDTWHVRWIDNPPKKKLERLEKERKKYNPDEG